MQIIFEKHEIEQAVAAYAKSKELDIDPSSISVGVSFEQSTYPFPHNFGEMLAYTSIKAVAKAVEEP